jgi:hypothetical protein
VRASVVPQRFQEVRDKTRRPGLVLHDVHSTEYPRLKTREEKMQSGRLAFTIALTAALLVSLTPQASAASAVNKIRNTGTISVGALKSEASGNAPPYYDELIPPGMLSGYLYTYGIYVGDKYCVRVRHWLDSDGRNLSFPLIYTGPVIVTFPEHNWDVRALPTSDELCHRA